MPGDSPLAHRDFRLLLLGQTTSQFGAQISGVAIPLLAVLTLDASPLQLGLVSASSTVAFLAIGLPAGAWVDRWRRRPVLVSSDVVRAVLLATIPLAAALGRLTIGQLIVVSLLTGVARVFFDVGYQSYLPSVIGRDRVLAGNSAMETIRASGQVFGPGLGGWFVAMAGAANVVALQAVTFAVSAVSLLSIRTTEGRPTPPPRRPLASEIGEGLRFVARTPLLRALATTSATSNFAFAIASAVNLIFLSRTLGLSPTVIGVVIAVGSVAAMAGAALTTRAARWFGSARVVWLALAMTGPFTLLGPLAQPGWLVGLAVAGMAAGELGQIVYAVTSVSVRQRLCPEHLLGRVNATMRFLIMGLFPIGAVLGGVLGEAVGPRATLLISFCVTALSPVPVFLALRGVREVDQLSRW